MRLSLPPRRTERRGLRLWHVWIVLPLTFLIALAIATGVFVAGWDLLGARELKPEHRIDAKTLFDLVKLSFGVVAGAGALAALVVAYRRQRVDEDGALREATRLHTERFTTAVSQLGEESAAVRLGGVHALAGLADDAPTRELRQTCIDVLCAYLRLPYTAESELPAGDEAARHAYLALREVRHTVIRLIRDHLRMSLPHPRSWQGHDFDFTGVVFDGGDFSLTEFRGGTVSFDGAEFASDAVTFSNARFSGGTVSFTGAKFTGSLVYFTGAKFTGGTISFSNAKFIGGTVSFTGVGFTGGGVDFMGVVFAGGDVLFTGAAFTEGAVPSSVHSSSAAGSPSPARASPVAWSPSAGHSSSAAWSVSTARASPPAWSNSPRRSPVARSTSQAPPVSPRLACHRAVRRCLPG
ncbi:pentapeptide repeat-containing protein [Streptomyces sp. ISL-22]|uniref:pentapeptide repeat-containing protein n=1 Tax=unclassified Streptomyces TaxID=2593676 RepID=UPI001BE8F5EE|nr:MULTISPECIES: pentapeptide repeat-containing protein [unclassified Streptomyces]MBT2423454.1 pentapeptide repeat-containing protein [Streptomyces sp. ISL-24]MBT2438403.1 pentapeptide repeat-containing protein [Streptomyces sp. ISL-22]